MFRKMKINQKYLSLRYVSNRGGQSCVCVCVCVCVGGGGWVEALLVRKVHGTFSAGYINDKALTISGRWVNPSLHSHPK